MPQKPPERLFLIHLVRKQEAGFISLGTWAAGDGMGYSNFLAVVMDKSRFADAGLRLQRSKGRWAAIRLCARLWPQSTLAVLWDIVSGMARLM
jgi:hypothetical protein